jgi:aryl-alcohol dehydrogenase-like predicted oxidoreductase
VRVQTRSAFLQGLLLMPPEMRPAYFEPWKALLTNWDDWCRETGAPPLATALGFCFQYPAIERIAVGVDSLAQLKEILGSAALDVPRPPAALGCDDRALIEPPQWKL